MEQDDEPRGPAGETARHRDTERFAAMVRALASEDPRFFRRVTAPERTRLGVGNLMLVVAAVSTILLGAIPLAMGIHLGIAALAVVGAVGCLVLPVGAPIAVRVVLHRTRPLRR